MVRRLLIAVALCVTGGAAAALATLGEGDILRAANWQAAEGLLPEEILAHYQRGEYENRIADLAAPGYRSPALPPDFQAASRANRGRFALNAATSIVEVTSGRQPRFIMGTPFPDVDPGDAQAATKIVWNYFYSSWYNGDCRFVNELVLLDRQGIERAVRTEAKIRMYDGAPEARDRDNPNNLLLQNLAQVVYPADLQGIVSLTWRYRDGDRHDSLWTYVPGLRRARQVSALNRSDGFMGSDISLDDGDFFDGKPEDFTFRLLGRQEQLVLMDPFSLRGESEIVPAPGGGWRLVWKDVPRIGADRPGWPGVPWAPVSAVLVRRPVWVVEAVPKDPNYLYGRIVLRFDAETYLGAWASKYDRAGSLLLSYQVSRGAFYNPGGGTQWVPGGGVVVRTAENLLYDRASVVLFPPRNPNNPADFRVGHPAELFGADALMRLGK
jgi:hypothetical protein